MATIEILGWKENVVGLTAWHDHAKSELKKRLRRGVNASPGEIKRLTREILARQPLTLQDVHDEFVVSVTQILEAIGAEVRVSINQSNLSTWRRIPNRGIR